jgi:leucyl/phenylalanyl-tRNA--protein transferase
MSERFGPRELLECYAHGVFPMSDARDDPGVFLVDPKHRGVIPLERFHVSARLARTVRSDRFDVRIDTAFADVVTACAEAAPDRRDTWINQPIERLYGELHRAGYAHSVECWQDEVLVGGLYGVALKGAFFGESMFSRARDASKVALVHLVARLIAGGYRLLDTQFMTEHLAQFGAEEISRGAYRRRLRDALDVEGDIYAIGSSAAAGGVPGGGARTAGGAGTGAGADTAGDAALGGGGTGGRAGPGAAEGRAAAASASAPGLTTGAAAAAGRVAGAGDVVGVAGRTALQVISQAS